MVDCPLHLGITEAGGFVSGTVKSAIGIGNLLWFGIGDTIRVSLSAEPEDEEIGRAHVFTPVTNALLVCRILLDKKKIHVYTPIYLLIICSLLNSELHTY